MEEHIANQNAERLANLSFIFFVLNGLPHDAELIGIFSEMIMTAIGKWYKENKGYIIDPETEIICDDAIKYAFDHAHQIVVLATISRRPELVWDVIG